MTESACRECHNIIVEQTCPKCGSNSTSKNWTGYVIIIDPKKSEIGKKMNIDLVGKYAIKVR